MNTKNINTYLQDVVVYDSFWYLAHCKRCERKWGSVFKPEECPYCKAKNNQYNVDLDKM